MKPNLVRRMWLLAALALATTCCCAASETLEATGAWVAEAPPGANALAAYLDLRNTGADPRQLLTASSPDAEIVELHRSTLSGGVMHMERLRTVTLEPRSTLVLAPGGLHFMLIKPTRELRQGDYVRLVLDFDGSETIVVDAPVRRRAAGPEHH